MICLGLASSDSPRWPFVDSLLRLEMPQGERMEPLREGPLAVDVARNEVVRRFLKNPQAQWLLWVDSDAELHPLTLIRLLSWNQPMVGALTFQRYGPCLPTVMRGRNPSGDGWGTQVGEVREWIEKYPQLLRSSSGIVSPRPADALHLVDRTGCHCLLTHRSVYEATEEQWFVGNPKHRHTREDMHFCEQVQAAGFPIYVDYSVVAGHLYGDRPIGPLDFIVWDAVSEYGDSQGA